MRAVPALIAMMLSLGMAAQQHRLIIEADTVLPKKWAGPFKVDSAQVAGTVAELRSAMIAQGHLEASCDSCYVVRDTTRCVFHAGPRYRWARLGAGSVPAEIASASGFRERLYRDRPITPRQMAKLFNGLLAECENNGFPFASVGLDSLRTEEGGLSAIVNLERGRLVTMDSILVRGTARVSPRYLYAYIGISPGDAYNESMVRQVDSRTRELPFATTRYPAYMLFSPEQAKLFLFLDAKRASIFNGIIGMAQDPETGKLHFTGDLDLKLRNALHRGEAIDLAWRSLQDRTQDLKLGFNYPFLFNTPFGADLGLKIFKQDTSSLEVSARAAMEYLMGRGDKVRVFINSKNSSRLGQQLVALPGMADVKLTSYGLGLHRQHFDYQYNPRKGLGMDLEGSAGKKRSTVAILGDTASGEQRSIQYELNGTVAWHIPVGRRSTVKIGAQGGTMVNEKLYTNELYRIGGIRNMRGADEAAILASSFAVGTVEYRFLFEENSNLFVFMDQGWWEDQSRASLLTDTPIGFGAGTSFETKAGIFSISYALGRQFNNPVELRNGKVHFGFSSLF